MGREEQIRLARQLLGCGVLSEESANAIKVDFPELAESEDERIRKWIYGIILNQRTLVENLVDCEDELHKIDLALAYLEKQKEQTPTHLEKTIAAYKLSDERSRDMMSSRMEGRQDVINNPEEYGLCKILEWSKEDIEKIRSEEYTKGFNDAAFGSKQGWSEEDEKMRNAILQDLTNIKAAYPKINIQDEFDWLKSLHPQPHWKPSEEQMASLAWWMRYSGNLESLYNELSEL